MSGMDWVRGIIGVEAMVRHGKKLSEGRRRGGRGVYLASPA